MVQQHDPCIRLIFLLNPFVSEPCNLLHTGWSVSQILATNVLMDTTTNQVISRSFVCVWVTGIAFPPNWTTLPHGQHMYTWSPASWKSGQPSTTRLCHTLDNHPDNHPLAGQKHIKLPALTSVGILGNDYYWIDGKGSIVTMYISPVAWKESRGIKHGLHIWAWVLETGIKRRNT